jgi:hypothetical protein
MLGSSLPYRRWLGDGADVCRAYCYYPRGGDLAAALGIHAFNIWHYAADPWSRRGYKRVERQLVHEALRELLEGVIADAQTVIREWPRRTVMLAHIHLPHMPAMLGTDLRVIPADQTNWRDGDVDGYERNLAALDALLGAFVHSLRAAGKFDDALVVLTSDHGWRCDPDRAAGQALPVRRVPLLVKAPHQAVSRTEDQPFELKDLGRLIQEHVSHVEER